MSLKLRLILSFLCMAVLAWLASAILAWNEGREQFDEFFDTYQLVLARQLATVDWSNITSKTQNSVNKIINTLDDEGEEDDEALGLAVFDKTGKMIFHDNKNGRIFTYDNNTNGFAEQYIGKKQKKWRVVWTNSIDNRYRIAIGQEVDYRNEAALEMVEEAYIPWGYGLIVLVIACVFLIHQEFKPLQKITKDLQDRDTDNLCPMEYRKAPKEIVPLLEAMNALLLKITKMIEKERCFIADAAHELRSPLTALNVQLDVVELASDDKKTQQKALKNLREGLERSTHLVEQMLALSKIDTQTHENFDDFLDWKNIFSKAVNEQFDIANDKNIKIKTNFKKNFALKNGQSFLWSLLLRNLLDNAIRYSNVGADINIDIEENKIQISNNKTSVDKKYITRLGERFFRPAGQKINGSGLGLSIVEKIASLHKCSVTYQSVDDIFIVTISM